MSRKPCLRSERVRDDKHKAVICQMCGRLIGSPVCYEFLEDIREDIKAGYLNVVLQMESVEWVNSTGVGILASIYTSTKNQGGAVYVVSAPDRVESLLQTVQLWQFLNPCESIEAALQQAADG